MCVIDAVATRSEGQNGGNRYEDNGGREERFIVDPTPKQLCSEKDKFERDVKTIFFLTNLTGNLKKCPSSCLKFSR